MLMKDSIERLTAMLRLPATGAEQDWDIELADANRVDEFIEAYEHADLRPPDRVALMALVLSSTNALIEAEDQAPATWATIARLLAQDKELHAEALSYWARTDTDDPEEWFPLTSYLRDAIR